MRFSDSVNKRESMMKKKKQNQLQRSTMSQLGNKSAWVPTIKSITEHTWGPVAHISSLGYLLEIHTRLVFPAVRRSGLLIWTVCWVVLCCDQWLNHVWLCNPIDCSPLGHFPGKNTGVDCHFLLQGIFPTQGSNTHLLYLLHWRHGNSLPTERLGNRKMSTKGTFQ